MGLRIDSQNRRELSQNVRTVSQSPRMHRELVAKACFTLIVRPFGRAFLSWVTERRGRETDRRQFHTESHLT